MSTERVGQGAEYPVPMAGHVIDRRRLHDRLTAMADVPVTLISAPAGSGKTLLAASWVSGRAEERCAWIALRAADDSPPTFWRDVCSALAEVLSGDARAELQAERRVVNVGDDAPAWLARLIGRNPHPIVVVFDNLHEIVSADIHRGILQLVSHASTKLRTVVLSRHDPPWPLHRMQLDGRMRELRAADLAFDNDEAAALFGQMDVRLTPDQLDTLLARTEGWAGGLRLAGLGISSAPDPARFIEDFSGDDHVIADYLMREVFDRQPAEWQDFLLRIAIVDEVCGDLADALTGGLDGAERLAELADANAFVHRLGGTGQWFRLHNLLLDFLHGRLTDPALRRELHLRAATWYQARERIVDALHHAVAGEQWQLAADTVSVHVATLALRGHPGEFEAILAALPVEVLVSYPDLGVGLAAARLMRADLTDVELLTDAARAQLELLSPGRRERLTVVLNAVRIGQLRSTSDLSGTLAACRRVPTDPAVLGSLGLASWNAIRIMVLGNMGTCELWLGDLEAANEHLQVAGRPTDGVLLPRLNARAHLALLHWTRGDLDDAAALAQETIAEFARAGLSQAGQVVPAYLAAAGVALDRDEPDTADRWLALAADSAVEPHAVLASATMAARRYAIDHEFERGIATLRTAEEKVGTAPVPQPLRDHARMLEAELLRRVGTAVDDARLSAGLAAASWAAVRHRVRAALDRGHLPIDDPASWPPARNPRQDIEAQVLHARYAGAAGEQSRALGALEAALVAAEPRTLRRPFLDEAPTLRPLLSSLLQSGSRQPQFAVELLDRMSGNGNGAGSGDGRPSVIVPLTEREGLMLRYLASTLSNSDISRELYISMNTVKTHQRMIYRKLAVRDRRHAVARGRELGLL